MSDLLSGVPALTRQFLERTQTDIQSLRSLLSSAIAAPAPTLAKVARLAHAIHGAGAAFGLDAVSESAGALERRVKLHLQSAAAGDATPPPLAELGALLTELDVTVTSALASRHSP